MTQSVLREENTQNCPSDGCTSQEIQNCKTHEEFDERATWNLVGDVSAVRG